MKRRNFFHSALGFVVPLILIAVLLLIWQMPVSGIRISEALRFLLAVAVGYPLLAAFCGVMGIRNGIGGIKWLSVPFMAMLGIVLAQGMNLNTITALIFGFWGAVMAFLGALYAIHTQA